MSKLNNDKINYLDDDYVVEITGSNKQDLIQSFENEFSQAQLDTHLSDEEIAKNNANKLLNEAENKAKEIIEEAENKAKEIIENAQIEAQKNSDEIIANDKIKLEEDIEKQRVETINKAFQDGYEDGQKKLFEELDETIKFFDKFCETQYLIEQNILKAASKEILDIIFNISKKILLKEIDGKSLEKIIDKTISLLENKENINIILSEKYAKILYEFQKQSLGKDIEFDFDNFNQYKNFNIIYSTEYNDDTIIIENLKERFDASVNSQLDIIIRNIEEKIQKDKLEIEEYKKINEIE